MFEPMRTTWDQAWQDVIYTGRTLARHPAYTAIVVLTLALGIGATAAIFSVVNAVLVRPLPYASADRLGRLMVNLPASESPTGAALRIPASVSVAELIELRKGTRAISRAGVSNLSFMTWIGDRETTRLEGVAVSPAIFHMLGTRPLIGRVFEQREELLGADPVIILSHAAWIRYFAADPHIIGRALTLEEVRLGPFSQGRQGPRPHSVIGVMPPGFGFSGRAQFWVPFAQTNAPRAPRSGLIVTLSDGISFEAAATEVGAAIERIRAQGENTARPRSKATYEFVSEQGELVANVRPALLVLMAAVGFVLLIACVNVANLLLARTAVREGEIAVRVALGAGTSAIARLLMTESLMLALLGAVGGVAVAFGGVELLRTLAAILPRVDVGTPFAFPRLDEVAVDRSALAFTLAIALVVGLLVGLVPAIHHSRRDLRGSPKGAHDLLVVAQIAMAMVLLVGGGLLIRSFINLAVVESGFEPTNVLTFQVAMPSRETSQIKSFAEELVARMRSVPGVNASAYARQLPIVRMRETAFFRKTTDVPLQPEPNGPDARLISRDYFKVLGIRVVAGRGFVEGDRAGQPRAVVINQALARQEFLDRSPVGQQVYVGRDSVPWEIVGVVEDVRQFGPDRVAEPQFFVDIRQWPEDVTAFFTFLGPYFAVRTSGNPMAVVPALARSVRQLDVEAGLYNVASMEQLLETAISRPRMYAVFFGAAAGIALTLAVFGIYSVMAYSVARRTREIATRLALGAQRSQVMGLVLRHSLTLTAAGICLGLAGAAAATRYLEGMLFGLTSFDAVTVAGVSLLFGTVAILAAFIPAHRATNVSPLVALRYE